MRRERVSKIENSIHEGNIIQNRGRRFWVHQDILEELFTKYFTNTLLLRYVCHIPPVMYIDREIMDTFPRYVSEITLSGKYWEPRKGDSGYIKGHQEILGTSGHSRGIIYKIFYKYWPIRTFAMFFYFKFPIIFLYIYFLNNSIYFQNLANAFFLKCLLPFVK